MRDQSSYTVMPCPLKNRIRTSLCPPPSKSHTMRAILFASLAQGKSQIRNYLPSPGTDTMIRAMESFGAQIEVISNQLHVKGVNFQFKSPENVIDAGNSGLVLRFVAAIGALISSYTLITGDRSIRYLRRMQPLLSSFENLGAFAQSQRLDGFAPIILKGPIKGGRVMIDGADSQPVSALIIASCFAKEQIEITVKNPGEKPFIDLTLYWLDFLNIPYKRHGYEHFTLFGNSSYTGFKYTVPSDFSSLAFPLVFSLLSNLEVGFVGMDTGDVQGDKVLLDILISMGACIEVKKQEKVVEVKKGRALQGKKIDINGCIDALPILAVVACFSKGTTHLYNGKSARHKECDRIAAITKELKKMGADIQEKEDGLIIQGGTPLKGCTLSTYSDHRMGMALTIAGLLGKGESKIENTECIKKTYPNFKEHLKELGANIV